MYCKKASKIIQLERWAESNLPVICLGNSLGICSSKLALQLHGSDGGGELTHGVQVVGEIGHHLHHMLWKVSSCCPVCRYQVHLNQEEGSQGKLSVVE